MVGLSPQNGITPAPQCSLEDRRERPAYLAFTWNEATFLAAISSSQVLDEYITSGFFVLVSALMHEFNIGVRAMTWPIGVTSMVVSVFLLFFGCVVDIYGGAAVYVTGIAWILTWMLGAGFATDVPTLIPCCAMQGLGTAAYLPAGPAMLGTLYPPGPRKNMAFSIYGAMAPLGSFTGILVASLALQYVRWRWFFWIGALLALTTMSGFLLARPSKSIGSRNGNIHMDWLGAMSLAVTTALLIFTVTEAADAARGQRKLYVLAGGMLAVVSIAVTALIGTYFARQPLLPALVLKVRCMRPLLLALVLNYGAVSLYSCYSTLQSREVAGISPLQLFIWFTPMAGGGCLLAILGGFLMNKVTGTSILFTTCSAVIAAAALFLCMPTQPSYWIWVFPAMICATIAIDLVYNAVNVFISSELPIDQQGIAGSMAHALIRFSDTLLLGVAKAVTPESLDADDAANYRGAFWLQVACGVGALCIISIYVRIGKAEATEDVDDTDILLGSEHQEQPFLV